MDGTVPRRELFVVLAVGFVVGASVVGVAGVAGAQSESESETWYVDQRPFDSCGPENRTNQSIQDAVDASSPGDTVVVCDGIYYEAVTVNKSLTIVESDTAGLVLLDGEYENGTAITVKSSADGTVIDGLVVGAYTSSGISVAGATNVTVRNTEFDKLFGPAVEVRNADGALVRDVTVTDSATGVAVTATGAEVSDVTVRNARVSDGTDGVRVNASGGASLSGLALSGLDLSGNDRGVGVFASGSDASIRNVTVAESTVDGSATRGVAVSTVDGDSRIENVTLRDLTVEGSGVGEGVYLSARTGVLKGVALRDSSVASHGVGIVLRSESVLRDVTVFRNRVEETDRGILVEGEGSLQRVGVRQNLVEGSGRAGVFVADGTDTSGAADTVGVRVTRNVLRDNAVGVDNKGDSTLVAWLNYWGADSGPSGGEEDPRTETEADGDGDRVSEDVRFDPWLGKGACSESVRSVTEGEVDLYGAPVALAEFQSFCAWDLAPLALRPDSADAAMRVDNLNLSYDLPGAGPVPADRPEVEIYRQGEEFDLRFGAGSTDASRFAGDETQLIVLRDPDSTNASFDVGFDDEAGETVLRSDAESATVREDWGEVDGDGRLSEPFRPSAPGSYTFVLVSSEFGPGVENVSGESEVRLDGGATVVGFETVVVRETDAAADPGGADHSAGSDVPFELESNLPEGSTDHALLLYDESRFRDATATVTVDATAAEVIAGEIDPADVTVESSVSDLNGFYRASVGFSALGVDVASGNGSTDPSPFLGLGTRLYDTSAADPAAVPGATPLNGSVVVVESAETSTTVGVGTLESFPPGTYRYVYVADQGRTRGASSATGTIELTTPPSETPTPTPTPATPRPTATPGGGGGGDGQPGAGPAGEVQVEGATLLNGTVSTDEPAVVRVDLANFDPARGRITLVLAADGAVVTERTVAVGASSRRTVFLRTTLGTPGTYGLTLDGDDVGSLVVTAPTDTTSPEASTGSATPARTATTAGSDPSTATPSSVPGSGGTDVPATAAAGVGPSPATGTDAVIALGMSLLLLYGVGVAVYVLREHPPPRLE